MEGKKILKDMALVDLLTLLQPAVPVLCYLIHGVTDMQVLSVDPMLSTKVLVSDYMLVLCVQYRMT